jgi:coiled-coil domain-containing protein 40
MQIDAQKRETRAALETLAEAEKELDVIHREKRQLLSQWNSALVAIGRREKALSATHDALRKQHDQMISIANETFRFKKDLQSQKVCESEMR